MAHSLSVRFPMPGFEGDTLAFDFEGKEIDPSKLTYQPVAGRKGYQPAMYIEVRQDDGVVSRAILKFNAKLGRLMLTNLAEDDETDDDKDDDDGAEENKEGPKAAAGDRGLVAIQEATPGAAAAGKKAN